MAASHTESAFYILYTKKKKKKKKTKALPSPPTLTKCETLNGRSIEKEGEVRHWGKEKMGYSLLRGSIDGRESLEEKHLCTRKALLAKGHKTRATRPGSHNRRMGPF